MKPRLLSKTVHYIDQQKRNKYSIHLKIHLDLFSEFLIHAADVEGLCNGIDEELVKCMTTLNIYMNEYDCYSFLFPFLSPFPKFNLK